MILSLILAVLQASAPMPASPGDVRTIDFSGTVRLAVELPDELGRPGWAYYVCLSRRAPLPREKVELGQSANWIDAAKASCQAERLGASAQAEQFLENAGVPKSARHAHVETILVNFEQSLPAHFDELNRALLDRIPKLPPGTNSKPRGAAPQGAAPATLSPAPSNSTPERG